MDNRPDDAPRGHAATVIVAPDPELYFDEVLRYAVPFDEVQRSTAPHDWDRWWRTRPCASDVDHLARAQGFVVRTPQLTRLGWSTNDIRRAVRRGRLWSPARGVLSPVDLTDEDPFVQARRVHAVTATAAFLLRPDHVIEGRSAAILHGWPTVRVPRLPELAGPQAPGRRTRVHTHAMRLAPVELTTWFGAAVTLEARTVVDLARRGPADAIMAVDQALASCQLRRPAIDNALERAVGWPGVRRAREVLAIASPLAESPLESVTRLRVHDDGFPPMQLQVDIAGYRVDGYWAELGLVLECDGRAKYTGEELWREKRREARLRRAGVRHIERVTWDDVQRSWPETSAALKAHFPTGAVIPRAQK